MSAKLRLIKFGGKWCGACNHMDKQRVLEQFAAITPDVIVLKHEVASPEDEADDPIADAYDAQAMPTMIFEDSVSGVELCRFEGGMSLKDLRGMYDAAKLLTSGLKLTKELNKYRPRTKYEPRTGGYDGVKSRAESAPEIEPETAAQYEANDEPDAD